MTGSLPVNEVQAALAEHDLDAWLLWDFHGQNPTAVQALGLEGHLLTRRWAFHVPRSGEPVLLVHRIERKSFPRQPGRIVEYAGYQELDERLGELLRGDRRIAMEYTPNGAIPYLSRIDAGTLEWIRSFGVDVVSSADLVQHFLSRLTDDQIGSHHRAATAIDRIKDEAFRAIGEGIRSGRPLLETEVQGLILRRFSEDGLVTDYPPVVAVDEHAGDPHYVPRSGEAKPCGPESLVLIDLWAKEERPGSVFADVTWTGFGGERVPPRIGEVFRVVTEARDLAVETLRAKFDRGERIEGWMIDRVVRDHIADHGYGEFFIHRTGHNIGTAVHGDGAHLDDYETHDTRALVPGLCFSIEPGVYLPEFGIRSEIDVVLEADGPKIYTPMQHELVRF